MDDQKKDITDMTPTELLMEVMKEFSDSEALKIVVVYTNEDGDVVGKSNAPLSTTIGLLEIAKDMAILRSREK